MVKRCGYVLADKSYDDSDIVNWVVKKLAAKAAIPIKRQPRRRITRGKEHGETFNKKQKGDPSKRAFTTREQQWSEAFLCLREPITWGKKKCEEYLTLP